MSLTNLYNQLTGQATIPLNQSGLGDDGQTLFPLLPELSDAEITLVISQGPAWEDTTQSKFTIAGAPKQPLLGMDAPVVQLMAASDGHAIQFRMQIETVADWTFGTSFPGLENTEFNLLSFSNNPRFILTTLNNPGEKLLKGLNFKGDLQLTNTSILATIEEFITGAAASLPVAGTVQKYDHYQLIIIKAQVISGNASFSLADLLSFKFSAPDLALYAYIYSGGAPVAFFKRIESDTTLSGASGSPVTLPLALQLPTLVTGWQMMLQPDQEASLADFLEFLALSGSAGQFDLMDLFTGELTAIKEILKALLLKSFSIEIIGSLNAAPQFRSFSFQIQQKENAPWSIIPDKLKLTNLQVCLMISKEISGYNTTGFLQGEIEITDSIAINAIIPVPIGSGDWQFSSRQPVILSDINVLSKFTDDNSITALLPESLVQEFSSLTLEELILIYNPIVGIKQLKFAVSMEERWVIIQDRFELASLYLHFKLDKGTAGWGLSGNIQGELLAGGVAIETQIQKPTSDSDWYFNLHANNIALPSLADLGRLTGGESALVDVLPESLLTAQLYLNDPRLEFNLNQKKLESFGFSLTTDEVDFNEIKIVQVGIDVDIIFSSQRSIRIFGLFTISSIDFFVESEYSSTEGWQLIGQAALEESINIGNLITKLATKFDLTNDVPEVLKDLTLSNLAVSFNTHTKDFTFTCESQFPIDDNEIDITVTIDFIHQDDGSVKKQFSSHMTVGALQFDLEFDQDQPTTKSFVGTYNHTGSSQSIKIQELVQKVSPDVANYIPESLEIELKDALFAFRKDIVGSQFLFRLDMAADINLSSLPLLGKEFPPNQTVGVNDLQLLIASQPFDHSHVATLNGLLPDGVTPLAVPAQDDGSTTTPNGAQPIVIGKGLTVSATMKFGNAIHLLTLPVAGEHQADQADEKGAQAAPSEQTLPVPATGDAPSSDHAKWFKLQKSFGPVHVDKVGVQYEDAALWFLLDASLSAAGLTLSLDGLSVDSPLTTFAPRFHLTGLGIDYANGPVAIGGAFLRKEVNTEAGPYEEYAGAAVMKTEELTLAAIGSYATQHGDPSLFVYAVLDKPLGGPAFFFVEGLAAGFGYNRSLAVPAVEKVAQFPLVEEAIHGTGNPDNLEAELQKIAQHIHPATGEDFLAVGVKFTSFKMLDSFALLTASFGNRFELDVLGHSTLIVPTPTSGDKQGTPLAEAHLDFKASYIPDEGFLGVHAQLTPASYLFSRDCQLTGGYAFSSWFSGRHAGDFVGTLGGYHPDFQVPPHYPRVPRLGFNWRVDSHTTIKGDAYYALTAHTLMAGGHLQATWHSGNLKAWFNVGADFLIAWQPYHYDARISVDMGVSYRFTLHLVFATVHKTISVDIGADLHLWGPDFSGMAHIHLWIVSFDVTFGSGASQQPLPIDWPTFKASFLPADDAICGISVKDGLVRNVGQGDAARWVINPKHFSLVTNAVIPSKQAHHGTKEQDMGAAETDFGIGSMGVEASAFSSRHTVTITRDGKNAERDFQYVPILKNVPAGLWGQPPTPGQPPAPDLHGKAFITQALSGFDITPKRQPAPGYTTAIDRRSLQYHTTLKAAAYGWEHFGVFRASLSTEPERKHLISRGLMQNAERDRLLDALGYTPQDDVQVRETAADAFLVAPQVEQCAA